MSTQPPSDLTLDRHIARALPRAWPAFFGRFGRLRPVQRQAIPPILTGRNVLVCSATASGKTEAACAPLVERNLAQAVPWTVLYISPTRALVNDLYERLSQPLASLGLRLSRRTGDHHDTLRVLPHVLLTTPESFDSLLCRGRLADDRQGHVLAQTRAVVLDEIHLLHGTPRGEQLRYLLERLRRLRWQALTSEWSSDGEFQVLALSATVPDLQVVADTYLRNAHVVQVHGRREIEVVRAPTGPSAIEVALPAYLAKSDIGEKLLVFCNARRRVDDLTAAFRPILGGLGYEVRAHHGSLSQREREDTEQAARTKSKIVIFATSTLEIGIDIGDIDLVVLDGPAPDVPALLQRIGRGNRRSQKTRVMACSNAPADDLIHEAMLQAAAVGMLGDAERGPHHAVACQQIASYIFQAPRWFRARRQLDGFLATCAAPIMARSAIDTMIDLGELVEDQRGIRNGEFWLESTRTGDIHSNIEGDPGSTVEDEITGQKIAHGVNFRGGPGLRPGGHLLEARRVTDRKIEVRVTKDASAAEGEWRYVSRAWFKGAGQPQTVRRFLGLDENTWPVVLEGSYALIFHFGGARRQAVFELLASRATPRPEGIRCNEWYIRAPASVTDKPAWLMSTGPAMLDMGILSQLEALERTLGRPRANKRLPPDVRVDEVRSWLSVEQEVSRIRQSVWRLATDESLRKNLLALVGSAP
jgi:ATP-dependent Lhr-like helicase